METLAEDIRTMVRRPLADDHVRAIRRIAVEVEFAAGEMIAEVGDPMDRFVYILDGEIEIVDPWTGERYLPNTLGPTQFMGEIAFLNGGSYSLPMRAAVSTRVLSVPRVDMLTLMSRVPELSDHIITVFAARRRRQIEEQDSSLKLIGADVDRNIREIASFAARNRIPFQAIDLESGEAEALVEACSLADHGPAVIFGKDRVIENPTPASVARALGLGLELGEDDVFDVVIVGGGPAGVAAGVFAGAEGLSALVSTIDQVRRARNPDLGILGILRTMHDPRNNLANEVSAQLMSHFGNQVFRTIVPRNIRVAEAPSHGLPVLRYDRASRGAIAYLALASELQRRLERRQPATGGA